MTESVLKDVAAQDKLTESVKKSVEASSAANTKQDDLNKRIEHAIEIQDRAKAPTDALTISINKQADAARRASEALSAWNGAAAKEEAASGVGVSVGGEEQRFIDGQWQGQSGETVGAQTTTVNITTPVNKNNIRDITNGQIQQAAMI